MRENRTSGSMRGCRKRATSQRACALLYRAPKKTCREASSLTGSTIVLKLDWWHITESRVPARLVVDLFDEFPNRGQRIRQIAVFVAIHLLAFEGYQEPLASALSYGLPRRLILICAWRWCSRSVYATEAYCTPRSEWCTSPASGFR